MQIARVFSVNRSTIYAWEIAGCPVQEPGRYGRRAKMDFEAVLDWYLGREEVKGVSEEGLEILEKAVRERKDKYYG